jgi:hypothetical protein
VDFAQARVSNLGDMTSQIVKKCSVCGEDKGRDGYQWRQGGKKRKCTVLQEAFARLRGCAMHARTHAVVPSGNKTLNTKELMMMMCLPGTREC